MSGWTGYATVEEEREDMRRGKERRRGWLPRLAAPRHESSDIVTQTSPNK